MNKRYELHHVPLCVERPFWVLDSEIKRENMVTASFIRKEDAELFIHAANARSFCDKASKCNVFDPPQDPVAEMEKRTVGVMQANGETRYEEREYPVRRLMLVTEKTLSGVLWTLALENGCMVWSCAGAWNEVQPAVKEMSRRYNREVYELGVYNSLHKINPDALVPSEAHAVTEGLRYLRRERQEKGDRYVVSQEVFIMTGEKGKHRVVDREGGTVIASFLHKSEAAKFCADFNVNHSGDWNNI